MSSELVRALADAYSDRNIKAFELLLTEAERLEADRDRAVAALEALEDVVARARRDAA